MVPTSAALGPSGSPWWLGLTMNIFPFLGSGEGFIVMRMDKDSSSPVEINGLAPTSCCRCLS